MKPKIGILLVNTGTPSDNTPQAVRTYLQEFLSDPRIIQLPRILWLPLLYSVILPIRPKRVSKQYRMIWQNKGSPMRITMEALKAKLNEQLNPQATVEIAMNYGEPSIAEGLANLHQQPIKQLIFLPLFPQFSYTTTASSLDRLLKQTVNLPKKIIYQYADHPAYIDALAQQVKHHWEQQERRNLLLISFHGMPIRYVLKGDPYELHCEATALALAESLQLNKDEWTLCYQSQFGYDRWLKPATQTLFTTLPSQGIKNIDIICPGFAMDCLETLEEIAKTGKKAFLNAGGETFNYIPALNASDIHREMLLKIIE